MHAAATAQQKASQPIANLEDISTSSPALSHARAACSPASQAGPTSSYPRTRQKSMQSSRNAPTPAALTTSDGRARVGTSFQPVPRVSVSSSDLDNMIAKHEKCGIPLIVEGWHEHPSWSKDLFSLDYLLEEFANDRKY